MKRLFAVAVAASLLAGCAENYDGRYPVDTIRARTEGKRSAEPVSETYPLHAWFEIKSGEAIRIHAGGVTSVYAPSILQQTPGGFEAVSKDPSGRGQCSLSFEKGDEDGLCRLTFTYDRVHYLTMLSRGKETR